MVYLLHHLLTESAEREPSGLAVIDGPRHLTYGDLDRAANQLAQLLVGIGVTRGDRVALYLDKSFESLVGIYGTLKAGAAYVPLDAQAPAGRLAYILRNCEVACILSSRAVAAKWPELVAEVPSLRAVVALDATEPLVAPAGLPCFSGVDLESQPTQPPAVATIDLDLAYILYTSGSTGVPKGVMLTHRNALAFVEWAAEEFGLTRKDRLSSHAPLHFDLSVFDLFGAACRGAAVALVPPKTSVFPAAVAEFIRSSEITVWYSVPSILSMMVLRGGLQAHDLPTLRTILFAGEVFPTKYLRQLTELLPHVRFANLFGPTETNVCTWYEVREVPATDETIPIGRPIPNDEAFALTDQGEVAAVNEVGELFVRGATVMAGYWGDRQRTDGSLVPNPLRNGTSDRVYRTGDLVLLDVDGNFRYLGRRDAQVKTRGYRVELGDIEAALYAHPDVLECAVVAVPDDVVTNRIKAYVVARGDLGDRTLMAFCAERIPRYMVPEAIEFWEELPKTSTGKVDRQTLLAAG